MAALDHSFAPFLAAHSDDPVSSLAEARQAPRKKVMLPALIGMAGFRLTVPCRVIDMSATGAGSELAVPPQYRIRLARDLPDQVMLILPHDRVEIDCEIQWRNDERFGARFTSPSRPFERSPPMI